MGAAGTHPEPTRRVGQPRLWVFVGLALAGGLAAWLVWLGVSLASGGANNASAGLTPAAFEQETGVRITRVALIAGGGALDVRFEVIDSRQNREHGEHNSLYLVDEDGGTKLSTPFSHYGQEGGGGLHRGKTEYRSGRTYYQLITNSGGVIERGDRVTVYFANTPLAHVPVQ
jgi:hypothetical protein